MLAGCLSSSPPPPSSTLDPSRISGSPFTTSMHSGCGAASTIPTYDEENRMEKGVDRILEPPILKRGMEVPQKWNIPGGTVVLMDKPKGTCTTSQIITFSIAFSCLDSSLEHLALGLGLKHTSPT
jgi:hypothetical protein